MLDAACSFWTGFTLMKYAKNYRIQEAYSYFDIAHAIFDLLLGPYHYRTSTVRQSYEFSYL